LFDVDNQISVEHVVQSIESLSSEGLTVTTSHAIQFLGVGSWSDTNDDDGDTSCSQLIGNVSGILRILSRSLGSVGQQNDDLVCVGSSSVGFREQLGLSNSKSFVDSRDRSHQWDVVDRSVEIALIGEVAKCNAEFSIVRKRDNSRSMPVSVHVSHAEVLVDFLQEVFFPLVVISQTSR